MNSDSGIDATATLDRAALGLDRGRPRNLPNRFRVTLPRPLGR